MEERLPVYANFFGVTIGPYDFTLRFGYKSGPGPEEDTVRIVSRIIMSPVHTKSMHVLLGRMLNAYERNIGEIATPNLPEPEEVEESGNGS